MEENKKRSIKNIVFAAIGQLATISLGLILPRLYITSYGSEINGLLNSINQYLVYLGLFEAGVGLCAQQALYKPVAMNDYAEINGVLSATNIQYKRTGCYYLLSLIVLSFIYPVIAKSSINYWVIFCALMLSGLGSVLPYWFQAKYRFLLIAEGKNYILTNITTISTVVTGFLKAILITAGVHFITVLSIAFLIHLGVSLFLVLYIKKKYKWINLHLPPNMQAVSQKNFTLLHQIAGMIFQNTDVLLLTVVCGLKVVSVYSLYKLVITHLESVIGIFSNSFDFILGQTYQKDIDDYKRKVDTFESFYSAVSFSLFAVALYLLCPFIKVYTAGVDDISYIDPVLPVLFVAVALLTVMRTPMLKTINFAGHFKKTTPQTIVETGLNIVFSIVGVFICGIHGVLAGTVAALLYRTNDIIIYANKKLLKRNPWKTYGIYLANFLAFGLTIACLFCVYDAKSILSYLDLFYVGMGATIISIVLHVGVQLIICAELRNKIKSLINKNAVQN